MLLNQPLPVILTLDRPSAKTPDATSHPSKQPLLPLTHPDQSTTKSEVPYTSTRPGLTSSTEPLLRSGSSCSCSTRLTHPSPPLPSLPRSSDQISQLLLLLLHRPPKTLLLLLLQLDHEFRSLHKRRCGFSLFRPRSLAVSEVDPGPRLGSSRLLACRALPRGFALTDQQPRDRQAASQSIAVRPDQSTRALASSSSSSSSSLARSLAHSLLSRPFF